MQIKNKGITLIALVITIIVILILAGVSINTLFGDNGLLTKAGEAVNANERAEIKDRIATEVLASYNNDGTLNPTILRNNLKARGGKVDDGTDFDVTVEMGNHTFYVDKNGNISEGLKAADLAKQLSGDNSVIGKPVTGLTGGSCKENYGWKIFYADGDHIYLIADTYIYKDDAPYKTEKNKIFVNESKGHQLSMNDVIEDYPNGMDDLSKDLPKHLLNLNEEFNDKKSENMQAVAYMLDSSIWKPKFVGENDKVDYVIGGPTIKQLFTSYNAKYDTSYEPINKIYESNTWDSNYGYKIRKQSSDLWDTRITNTLKKDDSTYCLNSDATYVWLASPSAAWSNNLFIVSMWGMVDSGDFRGKYVGFRPLVCLSSNVHLKQTDSGYGIIDSN